METFEGLEEGLPMEQLEEASRRIFADPSLSPSRRADALLAAADAIWHTYELMGDEFRAFILEQTRTVWSFDEIQGRGAALSAATYLGLVELLPAFRAALDDPNTSDELRVALKRRIEELEKEPDPYAGMKSRPE